MINRPIVFLSVVVLVLFLSFPAQADDTSYQYDDLHRLTQVEQSDGTVTVYNYDDFGNRTSKVVTASSTIPVAMFTADHTNGSAPFEVTFTDQSTGEITSRSWDFDNDGTPDSTEQNPSHIYNTTGIYSVSLTVSGPGGGPDTETKIDYITVVADDTPVANFTASPTFGIAPLIVTFTDQSSGTITSWEWDFDNNGTIDSTEQHPTHTFNSAAVYNVSLKVTGPGGNTTKLRTGYINVAAQPTGPILTIAPLSQAVPSESGTTTFDVSNTGIGIMNWSAVANAPWLTILSGNSGTDSGTIIVNYTENTGSARTGSISITSPDASNSPQTAQVVQVAGDGPTVEVLTPTAGEVWSLGSTYDIEWTASSPNGISEIRIYYHYSGNVTNIATLATNPGVYSWTVPSSAGYLSENASIRVVAVDGNANSSEDYSEYFAVQDSSAPPHPWNVPERLTTAPDLGLYISEDNLNSALAVDDLGNVHLVYRYTQDEYFPSTPRVYIQKIYYQKKVNGTWQSPEEIFSLTKVSADNNSPGYWFSNFRIALDSNNHPHISWDYSGPNTSDCTGFNGYEVYYLGFNGTAWELPVNVSENGSRSWISDIAVDSNNNVHFVWQDGITYQSGGCSATGQAALYHRIKYSDGSWSAVSAIIDASYYGNYPSLKGGENGLVHLACTAQSALEYVVWDGSSWSAPSVISNLGDDYYYKDITVDSNDNVHLVYDVWGNFGDGNVHQIKYTTFDGNSWSIPEVVSIGNNGYDKIPTVTVSSQGFPQFVWYEDSPSVAHIYYKQKTSYGWSSTVRLSTAGTIPQITDTNTVSAGIANDDILHVTWQAYYDGGSEVYYTYANITEDQTSPDVAISFPSEGDSIESGSVVPIVWEAVDNNGVADIQLEYTIDGGTNFTTIIASTTNSGSYDWTVPDIESNNVQVYLTATDISGNQSVAASGIFTITSAPAAVLAQFSADQTSGAAPLPVSFMDQSTGTVNSWLWVFGDGSTSTDQEPTHTYITPGTYTVSLTVSGSNSSDTETKIDFIIISEFADSDGDTVPDNQDNCPDTPNADQVNSDGDDFGAACDCDDNDATIYPNAPELCDSKDNQCSGDPGYGSIDEGCGIPSEGLAAYYPFNGNANDESGNGNHGTLNGAVLVDDRFGNPNSAYFFDGIDDFIEVAHDPSLNFGTGDFSINAWVGTGWVSGSSQAMVLIDKRNFIPDPNEPGLYGYSLFHGYGGRLGFEMADIGWTNYLTNYIITTGNWLFISVTVDRDSVTGGKFYVNGTLVNSFNPTGRPGSLDNDSNFFIGSDIYNQYFKGILDDIRIYNRALSEAEIQELYSGNVQINLYKGGIDPANFVMQLAASDSSDGSYPFNPPIDLDDGSDYYIGINNLVDNGIQLTVTYPNGGEILTKGQDYTITWQSASVSESGTVWDFSDNPFIIQTAHQNGLVAHYPFNGDASDASGIGNHGTVNGAVLVDDRFGNPNSAYFFDGIDDFIEVAHDPSLNFGTGDFSINAWVGTGWVSGSSQAMVLIDKRNFIPDPNEPGLYGYSLFHGYGGRLGFEMADIGWTNYLTNYTVTTGEWLFISVTVDRDSDTGGKFYVNGTLVNSFNPQSRPGSLDNDDNLFIGSDIYNQYFKGSLDDIRIYNRALTETEIQEIYNQAGLDVDNDGDGFTENQGDCNDIPITGSDIYPGATEICGDSIDQNCDGSDEPCDSDNDGVPDGQDNCPNTPNPNQADFDGDLIGDACDNDDDNDGIADDEDAFPLDPNEWSDNDDDGIGDNADLDDDNDTFEDDQDNCPLVHNSDQKDSDGDGYGDECDFEPFIDSVTPALVKVGFQITINGEYFGDEQGSGFVTFFDDINAENIISWSDNEIVCEVPTDAKTGCVTVTTDYGVSNCDSISVLGFEDVYMMSGTLTISGEPFQSDYYHESAWIEAAETSGANQGNQVGIPDGGYYQMALFPGTYNVHLRWYKQDGEPYAESYTYYRLEYDYYKESLIIDTDTILDADIPVSLYALTGKVTDTEGNGIPDVRVEAPSSYGNDGQSFNWQSSANTTTSADGSYKLYLLAGAYNLKIEPPTGTRFASSEIEVSIFGDKSQDIVLEEQLLLSGTLTISGEPFQSDYYHESAWIEAAETSGANQGNQVGIPDGGYYQMALFPGTYNVHLRWYKQDGEPYAESYTYYRLEYDYYKESLIIDTDTILDADIPVSLYALTGKVTDTEGNGIPDVRVEAPSSYGNDGQSFNWQSSANTTTSADGSYKLYLLAGAYNLKIEPPTGTRFASSEIEVSIFGDKSQDIVLEEQLLLSGTLTISGEPFQSDYYHESAWIEAAETSGANQGNQVGIPDGGYYQMALFPGTYNVHLRWYKQDGEPYAESYTYYRLEYDYYKESLIIDTDTILDADIPVSLYALTGKVTDTEGNGIPDVRVEAPSSYGNDGQSFNWQSSANTTTSADGSYKLYLLAGTYRLQITAPPYLFPPFEIKKLHIYGDTNRNIVLSYDYTVLDEALDMLPPELELDLDVFDVIDQSETKNYDVPVVAPRNELQIIVNWGGSEIRTRLFRPDGSFYNEYQSDTPPIIINIPNPQVGTWTCEVTAIDVPYENYPIAVVAGLSPDQAPVADAGGPYTGSVGLPITFDASGSYDSEGDIILYEWDWNNDGSYDDSTVFPTITHTWSEEFTGTVVLRVSDYESIMDTDTAAVEVTLILNNPPVADDQNASTDEDIDISMTLSVSDPDGDPLSFKILSGPDHGSLTGDLPNPTYSPNPNFHGSDNFTYEVTDDDSATDTATVSITVNSINDDPVANNDSFTTDEDRVLTISVPGVLGDDTDVDGDYLTAALTTDVDHGTLTFNPDGSFTYEPAPDYHGTDAFTYEVSDAGGANDTATVSLTINSVNDSPVANDDSFDINEDSQLVVDAPGVLNDDADVDGDSLTAELLSDTLHGTLNLNPDGSFSYNPDADYYGSDTFIYEVSDGEGASDTAIVEITIAAVNDVPTIVSVGPPFQEVQYSDLIEEVTIVVNDIDSPSLNFNAASLPVGLALTDPECIEIGEGCECTCIIEGQIMEPYGDQQISVAVEDDSQGTCDTSVMVAVNPEDAKMAFDDSNPVAVRVANAGGQSGIFPLTIHAWEYDEPPEYFGDIGLAEVAMILVPVGPGSTIGPIDCVESVSGSGYDATLTAGCNFDGVPVNTYSAQVSVNGGFYHCDEKEDALVIYDPSLGFATGGGWFYWPGSENPDIGYLGDKTNFGFTMKYKKKGINVKGNLVLIRHLADGTIYRVKSNALYGLALGKHKVDGETIGWASFSGKCTYKDPGMTDPEGNHEFVVYIEDHNEPGSGTDQFWIEMKDKKRIVIDHMSMPDPATDNTIDLQGGNVVAPH